MQNAKTLKQRMLWAVGVPESKKSGIFIFALLPTLTIMALIESKLGMFNFFKSSLQEVLHYTRSFWSLVFEYFDIGFDVTVFQADLFTLFFVSLFAVIAELLFYRTNLKTLAIVPKDENNVFNYFIRFAPLSLIYLTIVFPNIFIKLTSYDGFITVFAFTVEKASALFFLIVVNWLYKKTTKNPGFLSLWFVFFWVLYILMQIASIPLDYSSRLNEALLDSNASTGIFYYQFGLNIILSVSFLALYMFAWRLYLRVFLLLFAFLISDFLVVLLSPLWLSFTDLLKDFRDSSNLPKTIERSD